MRNTRKVEGVEEPLEQDEKRIRREHSGLVKMGHEVVCRDRGLVISEFEFEPAPRTMLSRWFDNVFSSLIGGCRRELRL